MSVVISKALREEVRCEAAAKLPAVKESLMRLYHWHAVRALHRQPNNLERRMIEDKVASLIS